MATDLWPKLNSSYFFSILLWLVSDTVWGLNFTKTPPSLQYVLEGQNATLHWDYNTSATLWFGHWTRSGISVNCITKTELGGSTTLKKAQDLRCQSFFLEGQATLIVKHVTKAMDGIYLCTLNFDGTIKITDSASVKVVSKIPTSLSSQVNATAIEGSKSVIITTEFGGDYFPIISWYKNNAPVNTTLYPTSSKEVNSTPSYNKVAQSNLTILLPKRDINNDKFVAVATYGTYSPTSNTTIEIIIWYGPENLAISSSKSGMGVSDGQSVTITCTAVSNPAPTFTFFHNNSTIQKDSTSGILTIPSFSRNDSGNYSCMATNGFHNVTVDGIWFYYVETLSTTTVTQTPTSRPTNGTTGQSNTTTPTVVTPIPGGTTGSDSSLPWWVWLAIALGVFLIITIPILVICIIKRHKSKKTRAKSPARFSKKEFDIDNYIMATSYPSGYENQVESSVDGANGPKETRRERSIDNPDPEAARTNMGRKFESEHDLIEHCRRRPDDGDDVVDEVDFKYFDPFEEDDTDRIEHRYPFTEDSDDPMAFDNDLYQEDDIVKVKSESDKESEKEHELFTELGENIVQYEI